MIALILLLAVLALRGAEANDQLSLDGLRNTVGGVVPFVHQLFPEPLKEEAPAAAAADAAEEVRQEVIDTADDTDIDETWDDTQTDDGVCENAADGAEG